MEKLKVELYDKLNYMVKTNYFDGTIHGYLKFSGLIDKNVLSEALQFMIDKIPVLHSRFQYHKIKPYWQVENYNINDALYYEECSNPEELANEHILTTLDENSNLRIKIKIFTDNKISIMVILIDHACIDGDDFKYFIKTLFKNYNSIINNTKKIVPKNGPRGIDQIYNDFSPLDKIKAKNLITYPRYENKTYFPWSKTEENAINILIRKKLENNDLLKLEKIVEKKDITLTDAVLAAMIKSLYELDKNQEIISIASIVNLRRYIKEADQTTGMTNYFSLMGIKITASSTIEDILKEVTDQTKKEKNKKFFALNGIPLLTFAFKYLPFFIALPIVKNNYVDAKVSLSSMGELKKEEYQLEGLELNDFFISGAIKYKPYFLMSCTTFNDELSISAAIKGTETDKKILDEYLDKVLENLKKIIEKGA